MSDIWLVLAVASAFFSVVLIGIALEGGGSEKKRALRLLESQVGGSSEASVNLRDQEMSKNFGQRVLVPVVGTAGRVARRVTPLDTRDRLRKKMAELEKNFPEDLTYSISFDTTPYTRESIREVFKTLRDAVLLVAESMQRIEEANRINAAGAELVTSIEEAERNVIAATSVAAIGAAAALIAPMPIALKLFAKNCAACPPAAENIPPMRDSAGPNPPRLMNPAHIDRACTRASATIRRICARTAENPAAV